MVNKYRLTKRSAYQRSGAGAVKLLVLLAFVGVTGYGGFSLWRIAPRGDALEQAIWHEVERGDFELAIAERGEIESARDVEVRSEVKTKNQPGLAILRIVPEGAKVEAGDFLVELDSSALREEQTVQKIAVNTAEALLVEAKNLYETAVIAKKEYIEGTFVQEKETLESELFVAEENLSRAIEYLKYSEKLADKGYVNDLQLEADEFAVDKAKKEADAARTKLRVLEAFTKSKMLKQLESDILIAKAKWEAEKNSLRIELEKLSEIDDQVAKCTITAPREGTVKFAHEHDRRGSEEFIVEEGAVIRERQVIIQLPDPSRMRVDVKINESLIKHVRPGMPAAIRPIGFGGAVLRGSVERINQYAEPSGWRKANVKEYKALVSIDDSTVELRSGMTASVTIQSLFEPDVLQVPVQAVYAHGKKHYCFVRRGDKLEAQPVDCGPTNDRFYIILAGLQEADMVAVNARALADKVDLPELPPKRQPEGGQPGDPYRRSPEEKPGGEGKRPKIATNSDDKARDSDS